VAPEIECLLSKCEALSSNPSLPKKRIKKRQNYLINLSHWFSGKLNLHVLERDRARVSRFHAAAASPKH
jgi:hypothetical protein